MWGIVAVVRGIWVCGGTLYFFWNEEEGKSRFLSLLPRLQFILYQSKLLSGTVCGFRRSILLLPYRDFHQLYITLLCGYFLAQTCAFE
jgi:hypothetical protein